jgi:hypothetical protein
VSASALHAPHVAATPNRSVSAGTVPRSPETLPGAFADPPDSAAAGPPCDVPQASLAAFGVDAPEVAALVLAEEDRHRYYNRVVNHEPSPEEIRAACAAIQAEWSPPERRRRELGIVHGGDGRCRIAPDAGLLTARTVRCHLIGGGR